MKIAYIALRGVPLSDGIVQYTDDIARRLVAMGHDVTVYTSGKYGNKTGIYDNCYKIITVPSLSAGFAEKMSIVFNASLHQLFCNYDVVHYHAMGPSIFAFLGKIGHKVTVIQSHGVEYERAKHSKIAKRILYLLEKYSINMGDELLVCSDALYDHFMSEYKKKTRVIHNAVNMPSKGKCDQTILDKYGLVENEYYLFMARLTIEKGLHYLIEAFKKINTNKKLVIAGPFDKNNTYHDQLRILAGEDSRIVFTDYVKGREKDTLLRGAFCFCLPSEIEGFSMALLEAMSYGKCCIVSDIPNNVEAVGTAGLAFRNKSVEDLFDMLQKVEANPGIVSRIGCAAKARIEENFTWDIIAKETEQMYLDLIAKKGEK